MKTFLQIITTLLLFFCIIPLQHANAHETQDPTVPSATVRPIALEANRMRMTTDQTYRYIRSNGIPNHPTGIFPNNANPNTISAQNHYYRMPLIPQNTRKAQPQKGIIGIAINGVPFEPGTAECYGQKRGKEGVGSRRPATHCTWREEAIVNGQRKLGLDTHNGHVQPTGMYHYHGIPTGLAKQFKSLKPLQHIGYAADGFKIFVNPDNSIQSGYRLKSGTRPGGPGGVYDGTYTADFEYVAGPGRLDECNGMDTKNGDYVYVLTKTFPYIPRCLKGNTDPSFVHKPQKPRAPKPDIRGGGRGLNRPTL